MSNLLIIGIAFALYGLFLSPVQAEQNIFEYTYDDLNRLETFEDANEASIEFEYDNAGNIISKVSVAGTYDSDNDGIPDKEEKERGTDPNDDDSDDDGIPDGWEVENGLDPLSGNPGDDDDYDGISNYDEYLADSDPNSIETDLVLKNKTIASGNSKEYRAISTITAGDDYIVSSGAVVTFKAGNKIKLVSGFKAQAGSKFKAGLQ